jgi:type III secretion protein R
MAFSLTDLNSSSILILLSLVGIVSFLLIFVTSFVKIAIVFGLLRSALGLNRIPPTTVITGLSIILSIYIMSPVLEKIYDKISPQLLLMVDNKMEPEEKISQFKELFATGSLPLKDFLSKHTNPEEKYTFWQMANQMHKSDKQDNKISKESFLVLIPGFLISEITEAFKIGFLLFLPFLVLDLLVANILMALGMHMLSPTTVSLPFKLMLFVAVNGFSLLSHSLVQSYLV